MSAAPEPVRLSLVDGVALIELDNPPVNALYAAMRDRIAALMPLLDADPAVQSILLVGAGRAFSAGVDLRRSAGQSEPFFLHAALDAMDRVSKPLLAAIHGAALGGGLELALACHYRAAGPGARCGLPEVDVGLIPGACGTQRLPRLIPLGRALDVAALGDALDANEALQLGLVDQLLPDQDFRTAALAWARAHAGAAPRRTRELAVRATADVSPLLARAHARASAERGGESAPLKAIEAVHGACLLGFDGGVALEKLLVSQCKASDEARALRHLFFAERAAGKVAAAPRPIAALRLAGEAPATLLAALAEAGMAVRPDAGIVLRVVQAGQPLEPDQVSVLLPPDPRGVVELSAPPGIDEAALATLARLLRPFGRALVIGRGGLPSAFLRQDGPAALGEAGQRALDAGIAERPGDIDVLAVLGLGYPRHRGGPMYERGLSTDAGA